MSSGEGRINKLLSPYNSRVTIPKKKLAVTTDRCFPSKPVSPRLSSPSSPMLRSFESTGFKSRMNSRNLSPEPNILGYLSTSPYLPKLNVSSPKMQLKNLTRPKRINPKETFINSISQCAYITTVGTILGKPKKVNQDKHLILPVFGNIKGNYLFTVCDGHGAKGHLVSEFVIKTLPYMLLKHISKIAANKFEESIRLAYLKTNLLLHKSNINVAMSGCTCVSAFVIGCHIVFANVGDSRAVLGSFQESSWIAKAMTVDHKPDEPEEHRRIVEEGGRVMAYCDAVGVATGPTRVWLKDSNIPGLAMSRSFGDAVAATVGVIPDPDITHYELKPNDRFLILASDGLWEFVSNQEAVEIVAKLWESQDIAQMTQALRDEANRRWYLQEQMADDITILLVFFET